MGSENIHRTNVMIKDIRNQSIDNEDRRGFTFFNGLKEEWIRAHWELNKKTKEDIVKFLRIMSNLIGETYYVLIKENEEVVAVGMGIREGTYVGVFNICVGEDKRNMGFGRKIMKNLAYESAKRGCTIAYLQVIEKNEDAKKLYRKLGYETYYTY